MEIVDSSIGIFSPTFDPIRLPIGAETKSAINFQEWALPNNFLLSFSSPISLSESKNNALFLNVNKHNQSAIGFYEKHGFFLVKKEVIDIGNGFIMDDFVFELELNETEN